MEEIQHDHGYNFTDEEMEILSKALCLYAGYTRECEQNMLVGDESDADKINRQARQSLSMAKHFYGEAYEEDYETARQMLSQHLGRPADINDLSPFDWYLYMQGELNR